MKSGIYAVINTLNNKYYIGASVNIIGRFAKHRYQLRHNKHHNAHLQRAFNKYGEEVFVFIPIEFTSKDLLNAREQYYLDCCSPHYNIDQVVTRTKNQWNAKQRARLKNKMRGRTLSEEHKQKIAESNRGKTHSAELKARWAEIKRGKKMSAEARRNMSLAAKGKPKPGRRKAVWRLGASNKLYESITSVAQDGFDPSEVSKCCKGKVTQHKGYRWEYANE